jgi:prophage regulatory protein
MEKSDRVLRKPELLGRLQLSDATVWRMERAGRFPQRIQLGGNSVGWFESEINEWLEQRGNARPKGQGNG